MTEVLMTLGTVRFSVETGSYQRLTRKLEIRVSTQELAGVQAQRQVLGEDETIEIEGVHFPAWKGGLSRLDALRALARLKLPQLLTDGMGNVWGKYILTQVDEDASHHLQNGAPMRQAFRIALGAYGGGA